MGASDRLLIIGVDSGDRNLILDWVQQGILPTFARLMKTSAWGDSHNPTGMVAGTVWPTFYTGLLPGRTGRFRGTTQFVSGTYQHADIDFARHPFPTFWETLSDQGMPCTVVDAPYAFLSQKSNVTQLVDWCSHSPWKDEHTISRPPELAAQVTRQYGRDPLGKCDFVKLDSADDFQYFRDGLKARINARTRLILDQLEKTDRGVLMNVFSECHCAGHQLWHLHDPRHPDFDSEMVAALGGDPLREIYVALDEALARILDATDPACRVLIFCSHGIGPAYTATHLLDEALMRLEGVPSPKARQSIGREMIAVWTRLPRSVRRLFTPLQKLLWPRLKASLVQPGKARRRFFEVIVNDASGGVRLNLKGREPDGIIEPGQEYEATCDMLERELLALVDPVTGTPIISRIVRSAQAYQGDRIDDLPDLFTIWNREHPIKEAYSESVGRLSWRFVFTNHRSGDHTEDDGLFFLSGPGIHAGHLESVSVADFAPTIAAMFGCAMPDVDGKLVTQLIDSGTRQAAG